MQAKKIVFMFLYPRKHGLFCGGHNFFPFSQGLFVVACYYFQRPFPWQLDLGIVVANSSQDLQNIF
jgi:hypothetical protein